MRGMVSAMALLLVYSLSTSVAFAQGGDLLDFGDAPKEKEKAKEEVPPEPAPEPSPEEPAADEPAIDEPAVDEPAIDEPAIDEPGIDEPGIDEPGAPGDSEPTDESSSQADVSASQLDKIKAVPRKAVLKKGRLELAPFASLSMNDPYYQHLAAGGSVVYYPHDSFGFGIGIDYLYANVETGNVDAVRQGLTSVPAQFEQPQLFGHFDLYWVPIYGKVSLFDRNILHFEFYGTGGLGVASTLDDDGLQPAANFGIGQRMFLSDWLAFRIEGRNHVYVATQTVNRIERSDIQSIFMLYLGASFFIPPSFEYSFL
ncbi:MAG: outer membrane beta-barrel domain-containing protein [Myxococcota bacterium]